MDPIKGYFFNVLNILINLLLNQIREDHCQVHEAYQYFRGRFQAKHREKGSWTHLKDVGEDTPAVEVSKTFEKITMGVQYKGRTTSKEANKLLRDFWPKNIVKNVEVQKRIELTDRSPEYQPFWVIVTMDTGYNFENWLDWPLCEDNWPSQFDKGLFKEESEWIRRQ